MKKAASQPMEEEEEGKQKMPQDMHPAKMHEDFAFWDLLAPSYKKTPARIDKVK